MTSIQRLRSVLLVAITAVGMLTTAVSAAHAHDQLIGAAPAANESLATAPAAIVLEFNNELLNTAEGSKVIVTNVNGESVTDGPLSIAQRTVTQPLVADLPNGQYRVMWRVVSADGHPIEDAYQFAIGEPIGPFEPTSTPTATPNPSETAVPEPSETPEVTALPVAAAQNDSPVLRIVIIALIGAGIGVGTYALIALRRKRANAATTSEQKD